MSRKKKRTVDVEEEGYRSNGRKQWKEKKEDRYKKNVIVTAQTPVQKEYINAILNNDIVFCTGPAGCGKTVIPVGIALQYLCAPMPAYDKLIILRPAKEACGERLGFLPGNLMDKLEPWAAPIFDNMKVFIDDVQIKNLLWQGRVETVSLSHCRGRSFNKSFIILDESQNTTPEQMLMILTRLGKESKLCINGDCSQTDIRTGENGLYDAFTKLQNIPRISFVELTEVDIVRHPLIAEILRRYSPDNSDD